MSRGLVVVALAAVVLVAGCEAQPCVRQSDCPSGLTCQAGACLVPPTDGAVDALGDTGNADAGADAAVDVGLDAPMSLDGAVDAPLDAGDPDGGDPDGGVPEPDGGDASAADAGPSDAGGLDADLDAGVADAG